MIDDTPNRPAFYIFTEKGRRRVGALFRHRKGPGFTLLLNGRRYAVFPPRTISGTGKGD